MNEVNKDVSKEGERKTFNKVGGKRRKETRTKEVGSKDKEKMSEGRRIEGGKKTYQGCYKGMQEKSKE